MSLIEGLGGAFVFSMNAEQLSKWYAKMFGFNFEGGNDFYYDVFWAIDPDDPKRRMDTSFAIIQAKKEFPRWIDGDEPEGMYGDQPYMFNLRTQDIDVLVAHLESNDVPIIKREDEDYGRFAWVRDPDGNRIELYERGADPA